MKAKTLTVLGVLTLFALMVVPVLALSPVSVASSAPVNTLESLVVIGRADVTPTINITPLLVSSQQAMGTIVTQTLIISNSGSGDLVWQVIETTAALLKHTGSSITIGAKVARPIRPSASTATDVIQDGSFEGGYPNSYWTTYSMKRGTPLCSLGTCFVAGAHTGSWWSAMGGAGSNQAENAYVSQTVTITPGLAKLNFWMKLHSTTGTGDFTVTLDSTIIFTANQTMTSTYGTDYALISRDVTPFADGQPHTLKFDESDPATLGNFSLYLDDVSLTIIDCVPSDLPWLAVSPGSGTTGINDSSVVSVVFNSVGRAGTYAGTLCIISNDPTVDVIKLPVTLKSIAVFLPLILR